jgi:hypothetical protein
MSKTRSIARNIHKSRLARAAQLYWQCPVCGGAMKPVWYSANTRKCSGKKCKTKISTPWFFV